MDETIRLKIKVGPHEFEAEGPTDIVRDQFEAFKTLIATVPQAHASVAQPPEIPATMADVRPGSPTPDASISKIMKTQDRTVSLTARPRTVEDAVLLILYGQKILRENDSVTGGDVLAGITMTGGLAVDRVDRLLEKAGKDGDVIVIGERRAKRYRLTNAGLSKARQIASDLLAIVA